MTWREDFHRTDDVGETDGAPEPIRVLVVDDHAVVRRGIRALLATVDQVEVVGEARDGQEALEKIEALRPDVILLDLLMPRMDGIEVTRRVIADDPGARILVLTSFAADDQVFPAIKAGALGYLLKDTGAEELVRAIGRVHCGESSLSPAIARKVLQELSRPPSQPLTAEPLTEREVEVLQVLATGQSNQEIAAELQISEATVRTHVSNILGKLHLASRTQAALYALREGLASLDDAASGEGGAGAP
ncbi:MAG: response regulator transcription factor [Anaerolineae bacterium]